MPAPRKRDSQRTRRNKDAVETKRGQALGVQSWPPPSPQWVEPVVRMYKSFQQSGMVAFFEQTDVMLVWTACEGLQAWYDGGRRSANQFEFVMGQLKSLGGSEAERRRMRIELGNLEAEETAEEAEIASMGAYRERKGA